MTRCPECDEMAEELLRCPTCLYLGCANEDCIMVDGAGEDCKLCNAQAAGLED